MLGSGLSNSGVLGSSSIDECASTLRKGLNRDSTIDFAVFLGLRCPRPGPRALLIFRRLLIAHRDGYAAEISRCRATQFLREWPVGERREERPSGR
jgi:hypothetical protein